jgi:predicted Zn finger-like uncharacterized protein
MSTLIICPACGSRYEIAAAIPPGGRKVRCSKCSHVWQAVGVVEGAKPQAAPAAPKPQAAPAPRPQQAPTPRPQPAQAPKPQFAPPPQAVAPAPRPAAPKTPPPAPALASPAMGAPGFIPSEPNGRVQRAAPPAPPPPPADASFADPDDFQADVGDNGPSGAWTEAQNSAGAGEVDQDFASFNAGALTNPGADTFQTNIPIAAERKKAKLPPRVAIGWGLLSLLLLILAALFMLAPRSVVGVLPGAARLYAMMGMEVGGGVAIQDVHYAWLDNNGAPVLKVEGTLVNLSSDPISVPGVVIVLQEDTGNPVGQVSAKFAPLAGGARVPFTAQIDSPPKTVRSLKVSIAKAG